MPLNTLLVKTASFNSQTPSTIKKSSSSSSSSSTSTNGFMNFLNRKTKRFSADIDSLSNKVTINRQKELQSSIDNNTNNNNSSNIGKYISQGYNVDMFII